SKTLAWQEFSRSPTTSHCCEHATCCCNTPYDTVSSLGFIVSLQHCKRGNFDLFILGHSIPYSDKRQLVEEFRRVCAAPIISLRRGPGEQLVEGADYHIEPDPEPLLELVGRIVSGKPNAY